MNVANLAVRATPRTMNFDIRETGRRIRGPLAFFPADGKFTAGLHHAGRATGDDISIGRVKAAAILLTTRLVTQHPARDKYGRHQRRRDVVDVGERASARRGRAI